MQTTVPTTSSLILQPVTPLENIWKFVPPKHTSKALWQIFRLRKVGDCLDYSKVLCSLDNKILSYSGSNSSLKRHILLCHSDYYAKHFKSEEIQSATQPTIDLSIQQIHEQPLSTTNIKQIDRLIVKMITADMQPISFITDTGFQSLLYKLEPKYEIKGRNYYTDLISEVYEEVRFIFF
jgi:hypothetical protein